MVTQQSLFPLMDIQNPTFAQHYEQGVWWAMHGEEQGKGPCPDRYLVENFKWMAVEHDLFNGQHDQWLYETMAFLFGMVHGSLLCPHTGQLRSEVTTLVTCRHQEHVKGYRVGQASPRPEALQLIKR